MKKLPASGIISPAGAIRRSASSVLPKTAPTTAAARRSWVALGSSTRRARNRAGRLPSRTRAPARSPKARRTSAPSHISWSGLATEYVCAPGLGVGRGRAPSKRRYSTYPLLHHASSLRSPTSRAGAEYALPGGRADPPLPALSPWHEITAARVPRQVPRPFGATALASVPRCSLPTGSGPPAVGRC